MFKEYTQELAQKLQTAIVNMKLADMPMDENNGTFRVVASDETLDRAGEVIKINWWDLENYMKNPIMLFWHDYWSLESIVGKADRVYIESWQLIIEGTFAGTENGQLCRQLYDQNILTRVSVGFYVRGRDGENPSIITKAELLECSFVPIPANPNAGKLEKELYEKCVERGMLIAKDDKPVEDQTDIIAEKVAAKLLPMFEQLTNEIKAIGTKDIVSDDNDIAEAKAAMQKMVNATSEALRKVKLIV